ncbi:hypothetical protein FACS189413_19670 [Bacteroidia bacterium]|nr:hypothetical protein FACS189413_19670 [Bacteroidia bacterium]
MYLFGVQFAYGSIRMEPVFMVLAQSAAVAAGMSIDHKIAVQEIDVAQLQKNLQDNPLADGSIPEILVDNDDANQVEISGDWEISTDTHRSYGLNFLTSTTKEKTLKTVKYTPNIGSAAKPCVCAKRRIAPTSL